MKFTSSIFDRIRVKPDEDRRRREALPGCEWAGCVEAGTHRAPKGRDRDREYWCFCLEHVRVYNQSYNYFKGMSDSAVAQFQKDALTGHRPTWKIGANGAAPRHAGDFRGPAADPFDLFGGVGVRGGETRQAERRVIHNAERKALDVLGLEADATAVEIRSRFKTLVKQHHPDANGGDRSAEDRLREVIVAYKYLKTRINS